MPDPLDYYNPMQPERRPAGRRPRRAPPIPVEFDAVLTRTTDHAGAHAVEVELGRQGVACFRVGGGELSGATVELHVRSADHAFASQLAAMVFARRQRLNKIDPRLPPPRPPLWPDND